VVSGEPGANGSREGTMESQVKGPSSFRGTLCARFGGTCEKKNVRGKKDDEKTASKRKAKLVYNFSGLGKVRTILVNGGKQ